MEQKATTSERQPMALCRAISSKLLLVPFLALTFVPTGNAATITVNPGQSWDAALQQANCGDLIQVNAGSYPDQYLHEKAALSSCTTPVTVQGAPGVTVNWISFGSYNGAPTTDAPDNLVLKGFKVTRGIVLWGDVVNDVLDGIDGGSFYVQGGVQNLTIRNSDWGPCGSNLQSGDCRTYYQLDGYSGQPRLLQGNNILLDHNTFHDMTVEAAGQHWECLFMNSTGLNNVTFHANTFRNCSTNAIAIGNGGSPNNNSGTWVFDGNNFGPCPGGTAGGNGPYCVNFTGIPWAATIDFKNDVFTQDDYLGCEGGCGSYPGLSIHDNTLGAGYVCIPGAKYANNTYLVGPGCDNTTTSPPPPPSSRSLQPGQSMDAAYDAASCGQVIEMASGSWPAQVVTGNKTCAEGNYVTFRPALGASVTVARLDNAANRVEYQGLKIPRFYNDGAGIRNGNGAQDGVIFRNIDADTFCISGGNNIRVLGGDIGPSLSSSANGQQQPCVAKFPAQTSAAPQNVTIQGALFHDHTGIEGHHTECLQVGGVNGLKLASNTFRMCAATASVHITRYDSSVASSNVVIENNFFGSNAGVTGGEPLGNIQYSRSEPGLIIRYNSFWGSGGYAILATFDDRPPVAKQIYGNAADAPGHSQPDNYAPCDSSATYHNNVWNGASCSYSDMNADPLFVSSTNLHLQPGSPGIGWGDAGNFPPTDIDGEIRSVPIDAGADEVTVASPLPPPVQCADGIDNDHDGKVDLADPGCANASDNSERGRRSAE
jgi:hypothetical protein